MHIIVCGKSIYLLLETSIYQLRGENILIVRFKLWLILISATKFQFQQLIIVIDCSVANYLKYFSFVLIYLNN